MFVEIEQAKNSYSDRIRKFCLNSEKSIFPKNLIRNVW